MYEPYVVLPTQPEPPQYEPTFDGYGMNKIAHTLALTAAGYRFEVLPDSWVVHLPHGESAAAKAFSTDIRQRVFNRMVRFRYVARLQHVYGIGGCIPRDQDGASSKPRLTCE